MSGQKCYQFLELRIREIRAEAVAAFSTCADSGNELRREVGGIISLCDFSKVSIYPDTMQILIVKLSSIGDVVHTLPAAAEIRRNLSDAHISWVVERRASAILKDCPAIDELIEVDTRAWRKRPLNDATIADIREQIGRVRGGLKNESRSSIDVAIDFQGLIKSGLVVAASRAASRMGFETGELREKASRLFLNNQVKTAEIKHVIDKNLALARAALDSLAVNSPNVACASGITHPRSGQPAYEFPIVIPSEDEGYVMETINERGRRFAILNPGGGWPTKLWPVSSYGQVADWLWTERQIVSFVTYGPGEEALAEAVAASSRTGAARPFRSSLKQFAALARRAELFVGGDTGPLHLAAACRTPIVGIYGPTSPERNGPFDKRDLTVGRDLWCRDECHRRKCWHWQCMDIPVSAVTEAVSARLAEPAIRI